VRVLIFDHPRTTHTRALARGVCVGIDDGPDSGRVQFPSCRRTRSVLYNNVTAGRVRMYRRVLYNVIHKIVLPVASRHPPRRGHSALMGLEHLKTLTARTPGRTTVMWRRKSSVRHYAAAQLKLFNCCPTTIHDNVRRGCGVGAHTDDFYFRFSHQPEARFLPQPLSHEVRLVSVSVCLSVITIINRLGPFTMMSVRAFALILSRLNFLYKSLQ